MTFDTSYIDSIPAGAPLRSAWGTIRRNVSGVVGHLEDASGTWDGLPGPLRLPEDIREFYGAFEPVDRAASEVAEKVSTVGAAVTDFADTLDGLVQQRRQVRQDIAAYHRTYPPGADLGFTEWWRRRGDRSDINQAIHRIAVGYEMAEERLQRALQNHPMAAPPRVPMHYPGGGDRFDRARASQLVDALINGTSDDAYRDYRDLLTLLASMDPEDLAALARENPNLALVVPPQGANAGMNRTWWDGLGQKPGGAALQEALKEHASSLVGNMEGLTYEDRSEANRNTLDIVLERVRQQEAGERDWGYTDRQIAAYRNLESTLQSGQARQGAGGAPVGLLSFDPIGVNDEPLAAISIGNPDLASHQSWYIPGMGSSLDRNIGGVYGDAEAIFAAQQKHLQPGASNNMIVWMGYDAPPMPLGEDSSPGLVHPDVLRSDHARAGGDRLRNALNGMNVANTQRGGPMPHTSVTAHSYGTTTAAYALSAIDHQVDSAVFFGSAGLDRAAAADASEFQVTTNPETGRPNVYSGTAVKDNIARIPMVIGSQEGWGPPRYSPTDKAFGGHVFQVDGADGMGAVGGHSAQSEDGDGYLDEGTQSLDAIARLSVGNQDVELWDEAEKDEQDDQLADALHRGQSGGMGPSFPGDGPPERLN